MTKVTKVAPLVIFAFDDTGESGAAAFARALQPKPQSSLRRLEETFHFIEGGGAYQVSILLMQSHEPPILACALNAVLSELTAESSQEMPTLIVPFISSSTTLKWEKHVLPLHGDKSPLYGLQIGKESEIICAMMSQTKRVPSTLQFHYEPLACLLQFVRILKVPTFFIIGEVSCHSSSKGSKEALETAKDMGELLANSTNLCFSRDRIAFGPSKSSREGEEREPWRALYG